MCTAWRSGLWKKCWFRSVIFLRLILNARFFLNPLSQMVELGGDIMEGLGAYNHHGCSGLAGSVASFKPV